MPGLERFVDAQTAVYDQVRSELAAGRKSSHWITAAYGIRRRWILWVSEDN